MPSGGASSAPPIVPAPWVSVSMKALRSMVSATARRSSGLLNGNASRLISTLRCTLVAISLQTALGACARMSFSTGTCRK